MWKRLLYHIRRKQFASFTMFIANSSPLILWNLIHFLDLENNEEKKESIWKEKTECSFATIVRSEQKQN